MKITIIAKIKKVFSKIPLLHKPYSKSKIYFIKKNRRKNLHKHGYEILGEITKILKNNEINAFCAFGTLLGIVRDSGFVQSDEDIDIGIISEDFSWSYLEKILTKYGMKKTRQFELEGTITEQTYKKNGVYIDFFLYYKKDENKLATNVYWKDETKIYDNEFEYSVICRECPMILELITEKVNGIEVVIPLNNEEYLISNYGNSWKNPDPNFKHEENAKSEEFLKAYRTEY